MHCYGCQKDLSDNPTAEIAMPGGPIFLCRVRGEPTPKKTCLNAALQNSFSSNRCPLCGRGRGNAVKFGFHLVCDTCKEGVAAGKKALETQGAENEERIEAFAREAFQLAERISDYVPDHAMRSARVKELIQETGFFQYTLAYVKKLEHASFMRGLHLAKATLDHAMSNAVKEDEALDKRMEVLSYDKNLRKKR